MAKRELTLREHLSTIQSDGGNSRWASLTPEQRSDLARKAVEARWAKKRASSAAEIGTAAKGKLATGRKAAPGKKTAIVKKAPKKK